MLLNNNLVRPHGPRANFCNIDIISNPKQIDFQNRARVGTLKATNATISHDFRMALQNRLYLIKVIKICIFVILQFRLGIHITSYWRQCNTIQFLHLWDFLLCN